MYKIFLVEDEIVVREGIKNNINWEENGFKIVGDESDGELAYPMIIKEQPDILITDIKMPFMDGLELSKLLKKDMPQLKIIIISGYSDFGYAQRAIDIGVSEYLLKPITSQKLVAAVKNAAIVIEKDREDKQVMEQYQHLIYQKQGEKRKDFFNSLVNGKMSLSQIIEQEEELGINMVASTFCIMLFQLKAQEDMYEYSDEIVQCELRMVEELKKYTEIKVFERDVDGWAFILQGDNEEQINTLIQDLRNMLIQICDKKVHYFSGIGRIVHRIRDLQQSYLDANSAFSMRYFENEDKFLSYHDVRNIKEQIGNRININELNLDKIDRNLVEEFLKRGMMQDVDGFVDSYFDSLGSNVLNSTLFRQYVVLDGYFVVMKFLQQLEYPKKQMQDNMKDTNDIIGQLSSIEDCYTFFKNILKKTIDLRNKNSQRRYVALIENAKEYIQNNYALNDVTLDKVASNVNMSPNYFSSLFNQETGITFIEYLTDIRMEKAKEYLRCTNKRITEIGYLVGYLDSHYFSYIFRKTQNCTPSEYRMQGKGEE
ncbi:MAG: response regulator [Mobilitalea sp.]